MKKLIMNYWVMLLITTFCLSCSTSSKKDVAEELPEEGEPVATTTEELVVSEHVVGETPVTSHGVMVKADPDAEEAETYEVMEVEEIHTSLVEDGYERSTANLVDAVIPIGETQTIVAFNDKNEQEEVMQVVSGPDGKIKYIAFMDEDHKDIYNVQAGMSGKEVKRLRNEIKHMKHKGDHFLYDEQSNIMYLMETEDELGNEVTEVEFDKLEVRAIVWKDKKGELHTEMISGN